MGDHTLFFYGTLMAPQILHRVIHGSPTPQPWQKALLSFRPAILHGYRRHRVRGADYPGIIREVEPKPEQEQERKQGLNVDQDQGYVGTEVGTGTGTGIGNAPSSGVESAASVLGTVVSGLTDGDLYRLDIFEGSEYLREGVRVRVLREVVGRDRGGGDADGHLRDVLDAAGEFADEGEEVEAVTYVWVGGRERLEDAEWDFEAFKRDKMAWWVAADESEW